MLVLFGCLLTHLTLKPGPSVRGVYVHSLCLRCRRCPETTGLWKALALVVMVVPMDDST